MERKAFNFYRSYYEMALEIPEKDRLSFLMAIIEMQFTGIEPTYLKGVSKLAFISQKHSILKQIEGFKHGKNTPHPVRGSARDSKRDPDNKNKNKNKDNNTCFTFDEFWIKYPIKIGKAKCEKKYKLISEDERQQIKDTIQQFVLYKPFESYNHPHPETYLNQKRWQDVLKKEEVEETDREYKIRMLRERGFAV